MIGFVYILVNDYMPAVYKVGCTERSPHERANELSKPSGVPDPFKVLCYIEVEGFQRAEQELHAYLVEHRISNQREFFEDGLDSAVAWLWHHRQRLSFCDVSGSQRFGETLLVRDEFAGYWQPGVEPDFNLLRDPCEPIPALVPCDSFEAFLAAEAAFIKDAD